MILTATPSAPAAQGGKRRMPPIAPVVVIALMAIVVVATGVGFLGTLSGSSNYACMSISHQGTEVVLKTSGLVHYLKSQYYISCTEGSSLPSSPYKSSCLTVTPQVVTSAIGGGASTTYYYLSAEGHAIALVGAPAPTDGTEIITPSGVSLSVSC